MMSGKPQRGLAEYEALILAMAPFSWVRGDTYTESGGKVTAIGDRVAGGHTYVQAAPASQVVTPVADAAFKNEKTFSFTGAETYLSSKAAAQWSFLIQCTGSTLFLIYAPGALNGGNQSVVSVYPGAYPLTVVNLQDSVGCNAAINISNSAAATVFGPAVGPGTQGVATRLEWKLSIADTPDTSLLMSPAVTNPTAIANATATVPTETATTGLRIGSAGVGLWTYVGKVADMIWFNRVVTAGELATLRDYSLLRYGV